MTRAVIAVQHGLKFKAIRVSTKGDPANLGAMLFSHYTSAKANHLVARGDTAAVGPTVVIDDADKKEWGVLYSVDDLRGWGPASHAYVMKGDGSWWYSNKLGKLALLGEIMVDITDSQCYNASLPQ